MAVLEECPKVLTHQIFRKIFEVIHKMTTERDLRNQMAYARQEAIEEGRAEGRAEVAREMLADGMPVDKIARYTELSIEEIAALKF